MKMTMELAMVMEKPADRTKLPMEPLITCFPSIIDYEFISEEDVSRMLALKRRYSVHNPERYQQPDLYFQWRDRI